MNEEDRPAKTMPNTVENVEDMPGIPLPQEKLHVGESTSERDKARAANLLGYFIVGGFVITTVLTQLPHF